MAVEQLRELALDLPKATRQLADIAQPAVARSAATYSCLTGLAVFRRSRMNVFASSAALLSITRSLVHGLMGTSAAFGVTRHLEFA
jgi:hypothetical protein